MSVPASITIGERFSRLTVLGFAGKNRYGNLYECLCHCGNAALVSAAALRGGKKKSCGCLHVKHGLTNTPEFRAWTDLQRRCYNPTNTSYKYYGARGITVCDEWRGPDGFLKFLACVGPRPGAGYSLDRYPNVNGNYEPGNVRWASIKQQNQNKRDNVWIEFNGERKLIGDWAIQKGMKADTLYCRRKNGWSDIDIVRVPLRGLRRPRRRPSG